MIEEPPLLLVQEKRNRPTADQIAAFQGVPTGFLTDAMNGRGALDRSIQPLSPDVLPTSICGPALTCLAGPADILAILAGLHEVQPGDVLVVATQGWTECAATGDRVVGMLKNCGGVGLITDGVVRDLDGLEEVGLPLFCVGLSANSPFAKGPGEVGTTVQLAGLGISSGDMIVGDRSGVVVVPFERLDEVLDKLEDIRKLEKELDEQVAQGLSVPEHIVELMKSDQVKRI